MNVYAAALPPLPVRERLAALAVSVDRPERQFEHVPAADMHLPLAGFGNLTTGEVHRLTAALRGDVATWGAAPTLRFAGATALEWEGDRSVWTKLAGDVGSLTEVARRIPQTAQRLGLFIDRRRFRPLMAVGTITTATTAERLERLVAELDAHEGESWVLPGITLLRPNWDTSDPSRPAWVELDTLLLGPASP